MHSNLCQRCKPKDERTLACHMLATPALPAPSRIASDALSFVAPDALSFSLGRRRPLQQRHTSHRLNYPPGDRRLAAAKWSRLQIPVSQAATPMRAVLRCARLQPLLIPNGDSDVVIGLIFGPMLRRRDARLRLLVKP